MIDKRKRVLLDGALIAFFIVVSLVLFLIFGNRSEGDSVIVQVEGREFGTYDLGRNGRYILNGGTNILIVEDGKAWLEDADCPDKLCVRQGKIHRNGETITCLPNKLTVTVAEVRGEVDLVL